MDGYYQAAVAHRGLPHDGVTRHNVFAAAICSQRAKKPGAMFRIILEQRQWNYATNDDTDQASQNILALDRQQQPSQPLRDALGSVGQSVPPPDEAATKEQQLEKLRAHVAHRKPVAAKQTETAR